jgi:hypothetical protein
MNIWNKGAMALLKAYIPIFEEIMALPDMCKGPIIMFGYQDIVGRAVPTAYRYPGLKVALEARGKGPVTTVDIFDPRADWRHDFNAPIPEERAGSAQTFIDIGCLEHVFDTAQCLKNSMRLVALSGWYVLLTPVSGCSDHGFHTFNHEMIRRVLTINGFRIAYARYLSLFGMPLKHPHADRNACIVLAARKIKSVDPFLAPQQEAWRAPQLPPLGVGAYPRLAHYAGQWLPPALAPAIRRIAAWLWRA